MSKLPEAERLPASMSLMELQQEMFPEKRFRAVDYCG
jgi:hypothetical protein